MVCLLKLPLSHYCIIVHPVEGFPLITSCSFFRFLLPAYGWCAFCQVIGISFDFPLMHQEILHVPIDIVIGGNIVLHCFCLCNTLLVFLPLKLSGIKPVFS